MLSKGFLMSYRVSLSSPKPTFGLGTMPGGNETLSTYSSSYSSRSRVGSATRRGIGSTALHSTSGSSYMSSSSRPLSNTGRPLPKGPGPLDAHGRKLGDYRKTSLEHSTRTGPLRADHDVTSTYRPTIGTLPRKFSSTTHYSGSSTTNDNNRSVRSRSVANTDRLSKDVSHLTLNGSDSGNIKASSRPADSDGYINGNRESRRDKHDFDDRYRTGSRVSRNSSTTIISNEDSYTPRNRDTLIRGSSVNRDLENDRRRDSQTEIQSSKSLSRQSSSSSLNAGSSSKYNSGGKVGLRNIGNTCFMNSIIQCLSNTRPLLEYCLKEDYMLDKNKTTSKLKGALIVAYVNLMTSFWKERNSTYVSPNNFKSQIQKFAPRFSGYQQQDAQEFLRYLLEGLHEDVNKVTTKPQHQQIQDDKFKNDSEKAGAYWSNYLRYDHSKIVEIFVGQLKSELVFEGCDHRSVTFDPFWDLSLPISKRKSECDILDCLGLFMKAEQLTGDESPTCAKCKKRQACTKRFYIQKFPPILVLHLKRFSQERYSRKITTLVNFPTISLDLSEFAAEKGQRPIYNLYAVSEHSGTTYGGHYTAKCKHAYSGEWNSFNDMNVHQCGANQAVSSEAYVLFFELANTSGSRL